MFCVTWYRVPNVVRKLAPRFPGFPGQPRTQIAMIAVKVVVHESDGHGCSVELP